MQICNGEGRRTQLHSGRGGVGGRPVTDMWREREREREREEKTRERERERGREGERERCWLRMAAYRDRHGPPNPRGDDPHQPRKTTVSSGWWVFVKLLVVMKEEKMVMVRQRRRRQTTTTALHPRGLGGTASSKCHTEVRRTRVAM